jgi:hypothetical protein
MEERERIGCYDLELVNLPLRRRRGVFIVRGEKMTVWAKSRVSGFIPGWTGNSTRNSRWEFRWNRKSNRKFPVQTEPGIETKPSQPKNMSGPG